MIFEGGVGILANLPGDFAINTAQQNISKKLLIDIQSCTGIPDNNKHNILVAYLGDIAI